MIADPRATTPIPPNRARIQNQPRGHRHETALRSTAAVRSARLRLRSVVTGLVTSLLAGVGLVARCIARQRRPGPHVVPLLVSAPEYRKDRERTPVRYPAPRTPPSTRDLRALQTCTCRAWISCRA